MQPKIVNKGPIYLVGLLTTGKTQEITPQLSDIWLRRFPVYEDQLKPYSPDKVYYGAWTWQIPGEIQSYMAGYQVEGLPEIPAGLAEITLPAARYAVFEATVGTFGAVSDEAYGQWLPSSPYEYDPTAAEIEYYPPDTATADSPTQLWIPIMPKSA